MNINKRLYAILRAIFSDCSCESAGGSECPKNRNRKYFDAINSNKSIAIYGCGDDALIFLSTLEYTDYKRIGVFADKRASLETMTFWGERVLTPQELFDYAPDFVILASALYFDDMYADLLQIGFDKEALKPLPVDIKKSDCYFNSGLCNDPLYSAARMFFRKGGHVRYPTLHILKDNYIMSKYSDDLRLATIATARLIFGYLLVRDILNAQKIMAEYVISKYHNFEKIVELNVQINELLGEIVNLRHKWQNDSICVFLLDGFSNKMVDQTTQIKDFFDNSHRFNRAYVQYLSTTATLQTMFSGKNLIDDFACEIEKLQEKDSPLLQAMINNGYKLKYYYVYRDGFFSECENVETIYSPTFSLSLWNMVSDALQNSEKAVYYVHAMETHMPFENGFVNSMKEYSPQLQYEQETDTLSQLIGMKASLKYVDEQFGFYNALVSEKINKVIMSDHGAFINYTLQNSFFGYEDRYDNNCANTHIVLAVKNRLLSRGDDFGIVTINDYHKLFLVIIGKLSLQSLYREYALIQILPYYNEKLLKARLNKKPLPARGIITQNYVYLIDYNGDEEIYFEDSDNLISDPYYSSQINEARKLCGTDLHDIFNMPKFAIAKKYYYQAGLINEDGSSKI